MVGTGRAHLRHLLVAGYEELKRRLTRRFGSAEVATEVLHEMWLRLGQMTDAAPVKQPRSYLYRMALNVAVDQKRADARWADKAQLQALLNPQDNLLDTERIVINNSDIAELERALIELPARRREIFVAALVEELPYRDIASRFGISVRSVEREMSYAFDHCSKRLENASASRRVGRPGNVIRVKGAQEDAAQPPAVDKDDAD
jgi:RNA polymerase sigma-70 factor (ECF subfamily)